MPPKRLNKENINTPAFYDGFFRAQPYRDEVIRTDYMMKPIIDGKSVIELGCGISTLLGKISKIYPNCDVHGLDFSPVAIDKQSRMWPDVEFILGDFLKLDFCDDLFDFVLSGETLEHVEEPAEFIKEMYRICKPGGTLILSTPYRETIERGNYTPEHVWEYDVPDIKDLFAPYGRTTIQIVQSKWKYLIIYCKINK